MPNPAELLRYNTGGYYDQRPETQKSETQKSEADRVIDAVLAGGSVDPPTPPPRPSYLTGPMFEWSPDEQPPADYDGMGYWDMLAGVAQSVLFPGPPIANVASRLGASRAANAVSNVARRRPIDVGRHTQSQIATLGYQHGRNPHGIGPLLGSPRPTPRAPQRASTDLVPVGETGLVPVGETGLVPVGGPNWRFGQPGSGYTGPISASTDLVPVGQSAAGAAGKTGILTRAGEAIKHAYGSPGTKRRLLFEAAMGLGAFSTALSANKALNRLTNGGVSTLRNTAAEEGTPDAINVAAEIMTPQIPAGADPELQFAHDQLVSTNESVLEPSPVTKIPFEDSELAGIAEQRWQSASDVRDQRIVLLNNRAAKKIDQLDADFAATLAAGQMSEADAQKYYNEALTRIKNGLNDSTLAVQDQFLEWQVTDYDPWLAELQRTHASGEQARVAASQPEPFDPVQHTQNAQAAVDYVSLMQEQQQQAYTASPQWQQFAATEMAALPSYQQYVDSGDLDPQTYSLLQRWVPMLREGPQAAWEAANEIAAKPDLVFESEMYGGTAAEQVQVTNAVVSEFWTAVQDIMSQMPSTQSQPEARIHPPTGQIRPAA